MAYPNPNTNPSSNPNTGVTGNVDEVRTILWSHKKKTDFTSKLAKHGFWIDCSMDSSLRKKEAKAFSDRRKNSSKQYFDKIFHEKSKEVRNLQIKIAEKQQTIAQEILKKYAIIRIQVKSGIVFL